MGVVMSWIQEKLMTSNGFLRREGHLRPVATPRKFAHSLNPLTRLRQGISIHGNTLTGATLGKISIFEKGKSGPRNAATMREGADNQLLYQLRGVAGVAHNLGLIQNYDANPTRVVRRDPSSNLPVVQEAPTIADATMHLQNGSAMLIEVEQVGGAGHAIAWYRSRGGALYFFDPNTGVYEVPGRKPQPENPLSGEERHADPNIVNFVTAWLDVYAVADNITWKTAQTDWYRIYRH